MTAEELAELKKLKERLTAEIIEEMERKKGPAVSEEPSNSIWDKHKRLILDNAGEVSLEGKAADPKEVIAALNKYGSVMRDA